MTVDQTTAASGLTHVSNSCPSLWDQHLQHEFADHDTEAALNTMIDGAHVNHVPVITGGRNKGELRRFYSTWFIPTLPPDMQFVEVSRTVGVDRLVMEFVATFTHSVEMPWLLPGVPATGSGSSSPPWAWCSSRGTSWPPSSCTGTRPRCWCRSGCWTATAAGCRGGSRAQDARPRSAVQQAHHGMIAPSRTPRRPHHAWCATGHDHRAVG